MIIFMLILIAMEKHIIFAGNPEDSRLLHEKEKPQILSRHGICIERTTGQVLWEKDGYTKCAMASTTKILTGIIIIENCDLNEEVEISKKAASIGGSVLGIKEGQKMTVEALLYGLLLRSGNDAAIALAEHLSGNVIEFCEKMNQKAKELGLKNSNFVTPHGLDNEEHYTTAYDLACLTNYALNNAVFKKFVNTKQITITIGNRQRILTNTNELLGNVEGVYGVKTGFTGNAGRCLITACKREDLDIIIVMLGADTKQIRGSDTKKIIEYVFSHFQMINLENEVKELFTYFKKIEKIEVQKSLAKMKFDFERKENYNCPIDKNDLENLKMILYYSNEIKAPIKQETVIGKMRITCDNQILLETEIYTINNVNRISWKEYLSIFVKKYITFYVI